MNGREERKKKIIIIKIKIWGRRKGEKQSIKKRYKP
jgi:hypothetical protein